MNDVPREASNSPNQPTSVHLVRLVNTTVYVPRLGLLSNHMQASWRWTRILIVSWVLVFLTALVSGAHARESSNGDCHYGANVSNVETADLRITATFHALGVYWRPDQRSASKPAYALFRQQDNDEEYRQSLDFIFAADKDEYRGSLVHLKSGTTYDVVLVVDGKEISTVLADTWCDHLPIGDVIRAKGDADRSTTLKIKNVRGSPSGYVLYTPAIDNGQVPDGTTAIRNIIVENSAYVIIRGFSLTGAAQDAILIKGAEPTHDILIEYNLIEGWGRVDPANGLALPNSAIKTANGQGENYERIIIQRNILRNPRGDANSWNEWRADVEECQPERCHPKGATGIYFKESAGNHVIRYNEIYGSNGNYLVDGIGGARDGGSIGSFHRDTDIYGNVVMNTWDDAIESEGGNLNLRIWGNYIDQSFVAFGLAPVTDGPAYVFRNIVFRTQRASEEADNSGVFLKTEMAGEDPTNRLFLFHNTVYRYQNVGGVEVGVKGNGGPIPHVYSRNNIIDAKTRAFAGRSRVDEKLNNLDFDLYQGTLKNLSSQQQNGIRGFANYEDACGRGRFFLEHGTAGVDDGAVLPNFNDDRVEQPDRGAQESGREPLEFGIEAYINASDTALFRGKRQTIMGSVLASCIKHARRVSPNQNFAK